MFTHFLNSDVLEKYKLQIDELSSPSFVLLPFGAGR